MVGFESFEARRLFSFAKSDPNFGSGGLLDVSGPTDAGASGDITALADGRVIVRRNGSGSSGTPTVIQYRRGDGSLDTKRGDDGSINGIASGEPIAVNASTGWLARFRTLDTGRFALDVHDPRGRRFSRVDLTEPGASASSVAFLGNSRIVTVSLRNDAQSANKHAVVAIIRVFDSNGTAYAPAAGFGTGGRVELTLAGNLDSYDALLAGKIRGDADGGLLLPYFLLDRGTSSAQKSFRDSIVRLTSSGSVDTSYGTNGVATTYSVDGDSDEGSVSYVTNDRTLGSDGALWVLTTVSTPLEGSRMSELRLYRVDTDGRTISSITVGRAAPEYFNQGIGGRVTADANGHVYVATRGNGSAAQVFRYSYSNQIDKNQNWTDFGDAVQTTQDLAPTDLSVDSHGHLLVIGALNTAAQSQMLGVYAFNGRTNYGEVAGGTASLLRDGTLLIKGSAKADTIRIRRASRDNSTAAIIVSVNGGKTTMVDPSKVHGVLIQAGKGDDLVDAGSLSAEISVYIEGGAGNDTLRGSDGGRDTLVGDSGNDQLEGNGGPDHLYGQDGNDRLYGGDDPDELFGARGDDQLFGFRPARNDDVRDDLYGGAGHNALEILGPNKRGHDVAH